MLSERHGKSPKTGETPFTTTGHRPLTSGVLLPVAGALALATILLFRVVAPGAGSDLESVLFAASFVLFMLPGLVGARLLTGPHLPGPARLPVAFVMSAGVYGLAGVGALVLHLGLNSYLLACAALLGGSLVLATLGALYGWSREVSRVARGYGGSPPDRLLWVPFAGLAGVLAYAARNRVPAPEEDFWTYLGYVRQFLSTESLGTYLPGYGTEAQGFSRLLVNGWLLVQAALSRVSGIDPVVLVSGYLGPTLVGVALLAVYALALVLTGSRPAALLTGSVVAVLFLSGIDATLLPDGSELVGRVTEDKFAARFIFLPVALLFAALFLKARGLRYLWLFLFACLTVAAVHPLGLVFIGIPVAGLVPLYLAANLRDRRAWLRAGALGAGLIGLVGLPAGYLLATGSPLLSKLETMPEVRAEYLVSVWQASDRLLALGDGVYIMHPALLLEPAILASYALGVPFLAWRLRRDIAAQLLLGTLVVVPVLLYVPPLTTAIAEAVGPWMLFRLAWPLPLAAGLTLGWAGWTAVRYAGERLAGPAAHRGFASLLALLLVAALISVTLPRGFQGIRAIANTGETAQAEATCEDPAFRWMSENLGPGGSQQTFLAPGPESGCIPAYVAPAGVFSQRDPVPQDGAQEGGETPESFAARRAESAESFLGARTLNTSMVNMLKTQRVGYVLLPQDSPLNPQLAGLPTVTALENPSNRYQLYRVDPAGLNVTPTVRANSYLANGAPEKATDLYQQALSGASSGASRADGGRTAKLAALTGLAEAYLQLGRPGPAAAVYERALSLAPPDQQPALYTLASDARTQAGDLATARSTLADAAGRFPENAALRQSLASALVFSAPEEAIAEQRALVEMYPEVADYHLRLAYLLLAESEASEATAEKHFERARELEPLSTELEAEIGRYRTLAGDSEAAADAYAGAVDLDPENPYYRLKLGEAYSALALDDNDSSGGYYEKAEAELQRAVELELLPWQEPALRAEAWVGLGGLYSEKGREERAVRAYEAAVEADPDSTLAREKLEGIR